MATAPPDPAQLKAQKEVQQLLKKATQFIKKINKSSVDLTKELKGKADQ